MRLLRLIGSFLYAIRWFLIVVIGIGLPIYPYLIFAKEPVFGPEDDVELGKMSAQSLAEDPEESPSWKKASTPRPTSISEEWLAASKKPATTFAFQRL